MALIAIPCCTSIAIEDLSEFANTSKEHAIATMEKWVTTLQTEGEIAESSIVAATTSAGTDGAADNVGGAKVSPNTELADRRRLEKSSMEETMPEVQVEEGIVPDRSQHMRSRSRHRNRWTRRVVSPTPSSSSAPSTIRRSPPRCGRCILGLRAGIRLHSEQPTQRTQEHDSELDDTLSWGE